MVPALGGALNAIRYHLIRLHHDAKAREEVDGEIPSHMEDAIRALDMAVDCIAENWGSLTRPDEYMRLLWNLPSEPGDTDRNTA